jgi:hypothetical protein
MLRGLLAAVAVQVRVRCRNGSRTSETGHQRPARPQGLSVFAARHGDHAAEPGLGDVATKQSASRGLTRGFVYLAVVLDWARPRRVLAWRLGGGLVKYGEVYLRACEKRRRDYDSSVVLVLKFS